MLLLVKSPLKSDYSDFLAHCIEELSRDDPGVKVIVLDLVTDSHNLNYVLSTLYTQIRGLLAAKGFGHQTQVDVYFNLPSWRLKAWKASVIYVEASETVPQELGTTRLKRISKPAIPKAEPPSSSTDTSNSVSGEGPHKQFSFYSVAVGGTFDHFHDGHKILLSMASFVTRGRLIVGITGPELLKNKQFAQMLQSLEHRVKVVCKYLEDILQNHQSYVIYQINDVCGPTGYIADIAALVISDETLQGARFVNEYRSKASMPVLAVIAVKVLGGNGNAENNWRGKLSSTDFRKAEFETRFLNSETQ